MKKSFYVSILFTALLSAVPAHAQMYATLGTGFTHVNGAGLTSDYWNADGSLVLFLPRSGLNFQGNVGYDTNLQAFGGHASDFNGGVDVYLSDPSYRAGATLKFSGLPSNGSGSGHIVNYGAFAEFFVGPFTGGAKVGGFSGSENTSGFYTGAEADVYVLRNLAVSGTIDYARFSAAEFAPEFSETDFTTQAEWLVSSKAPLSFYGGYTFSSFSHSPGGQASTVFMGLRLYMNGWRPASLQQRQRTGTVTWADRFGPEGANL